MTTLNILRWIKANLAADLQKAITDSGSVIYTEDWLAGMVLRETGDLIARYAPIQKDVKIIAASMRGDYTQRKNETEKQYHGYGFIQIDIASYPEYVKSGKWKIPYENFKMAIGCLEFSRKYLVKEFSALNGDSLNHYITAAFNCGVGNERKIIEQAKDPDAYTAGHDYSRAVFQFAEIYRTL